MNRTAALLAVAAGIGAVLYFMRQAQAVQADTSYMQDAADNSFLGDIVDTVKSEVSNMTASVPDALADSNVQAFLRLIRTGEGTADAAGYSRIFGGAQFYSFADHPRVRVPFGNTYSTAAGAYQFLSRTWDEMRDQYGLPDFSPASQDLAAVGLIKRRGALGDVLAGRFATAIRKCNREWASLPGSPYGQPTLTMGKAAVILANNGGSTTEAIV